MRRQQSLSSPPSAMKSGHGAVCSRPADDAESFSVNTSAQGEAAEAHDARVRRHGAGIRPCANRPGGHCCMSRCCCTGSGLHARSSHEPCCCAVKCDCKAAIDIAGRHSAECGSAAGALRWCFALETSCCPCAGGRPHPAVGAAAAAARHPHLHHAATGAGASRHNGSGAARRPRYLSGPHQPAGGDIVNAHTHLNFTQTVAVPELHAARGTSPELTSQLEVGCQIS